MDGLDLGRRAVAAPGWRWLPGMLISDYGAGVRFCWMDDTHMHGAAAEGGAWMCRPHRADNVPDLSDPATLGCLLALVREAHDEPTLVVHAYDKRNERVGYDLGAKSPVFSEIGRWGITVPTNRSGLARVFHGATEAEALVAALEAAGRQG